MDFDVMKRKIISSKKTGKEYSKFLIIVNDGDDEIYCTLFMSDVVNADYFTAFRVVRKGSFGYSLVSDTGVYDLEVIL